MADQQNEPGYLYHVYDGKIVLERTSLSRQLRAHYQGDPKFAGKLIAFGFKPLTDAELARYEKHYNLKFDLAERPALKPWTPKNKRQPAPAKK